MHMQAQLAKEQASSYFIAQPPWRGMLISLLLSAVPALPHPSLTHSRTLLRLWDALKQVSSSSSWLTFPKQGSTNASLISQNQALATQTHMNYFPLLMNICPTTENFQPHIAPESKHVQSPWQIAMCALGPSTAGSSLRAFGDRKDLWTTPLLHWCSKLLHQLTLGKLC